MKKRILAVLLSVLTIAAIFVGCGSSEETDDRERRRESRRTEDEAQTKDEGKPLNQRQMMTAVRIEKDMYVLSAICAEANMSLAQNNYLLDDWTGTIIVNLGTVHETGRATTTTGVEDELLSVIWELRGCQSIEEVNEMMYSDITNIEIIYDLDASMVTVQAYNSEGPILESVESRL